MNARHKWVKGILFYIYDYQKGIPYTTNKNICRRKTGAFLFLFNSTQTQLHLIKPKTVNARIINRCLPIAPTYEGFPYNKIRNTRRSSLGYMSMPQIRESSFCTNGNKRNLSHPQYEHNYSKKKRAAKIL